MNLKGYRRNISWPISIHIPKVALEDLGKLLKELDPGQPASGEIMGAETS